jgi:hypothetical protein
LVIGNEKFKAFYWYVPEDPVCSDGRAAVFVLYLYLLKRCLRFFLSGFWCMLLQLTKRKLKKSLCLAVYAGFAEKSETVVPDGDAIWERGISLLFLHLTGGSERVAVLILQEDSCYSHSFRNGCFGEL